MSDSKESSMTRDLERVEYLLTVCREAMRVCEDLERRIAILEAARDAEMSSDHKPVLVDSD